MSTVTTSALATAATLPLGGLQIAFTRLDGLLHRAVAAADSQFGADAATDPYRGLQITRAEVDRLLAQPTGAASLYAGRLCHEAPGDVHAAWPRLAQLQRLFELSPFDVDTLLVALAPDLDLRYERLFAYLQDDVTKKRPSIDLILSLLCENWPLRLAARERFAAAAPLIAHRLIALSDDPAQPQAPLLARCVRIDERVLAYLLGGDVLDPRLSGCVELSVPRDGLAGLRIAAELHERWQALVEAIGRPGPRVVLYVHGPYGAGKRTTAAALAAELGVPLLVLHGAGAGQTDVAAYRSSLQLAVREAELQGALLYVDGIDSVLTDERRPWCEALLAALNRAGRLVVLGGAEPWDPGDRLGNATFVRVELPRPAYATRLELWTATLANIAHTPELALEVLGNAFRLTPGQINDAAATARGLAYWRAGEDAPVSMADLTLACRLQSNRKLGSVARRITPHYAWDDIILPPDRLQQLREICNHVTHRALVYDTWGFDRKLALGKGLNVLFAGPSGTGKTMAAEIIAAELGLDLYKIDLSTVVSKYIGETEKNLARIFDEAATSNAILFFDEADALFGKRTEVRDSHDRYANIETNYLLQKMEEHEGVVILATNFRKNMDDAFVRRLHFVVDFPFPNEADRRRIWERTWPADAPRSGDVDWDVIARRFELAGGNIRNIALSAAFLAADNGGVVHMDHLLHGTRRELQKIGKVVSSRERERE